MAVKVLNAKKVGKYLENSVYIGRPSVWGNPFVIAPNFSREEVVAAYREWILNNPSLIDRAKKELKDKNLICWCAPLACHGDVLMELANG